HKFKHVGIALATSGASWLNAIVLFILLKKRGFMKLDQSLYFFMLKIVIPCCATLITLHWTQVITHPYISLSQSIFNRSVGLIVLVSSGLIVFVVSAWLLGLMRFKET